MEQALRESEETFRTLAEKSPNMIFINQKGRVVYANEKCEVIMGFNREHFYSPAFDFFSLIAPESLDSVKASFRKHMEGEEVPPYEYSLITREGKRVEAIITTKLIHYGGEGAILGIVTDITERKQMEEELRKSEKRYQDLYDSSPDMYFSVSHNGMVTSVNQHGAEYLGYSKKELIGRPVWVVVHEDDLSRVQEHVKKIFEQRLMTSELEFRKLRKDGSTIWVYELTSLVLDKNNEPSELRILCRDITDRKRMEEELRKHHNNLKELVKEHTVELTETNEQLQKEIANRILAEQQLKASLSEKEILLREIHHRVKGNLQFISSLLNLQKKDIPDERVRKIFDDYRNQIKAMSLIHDRLYRLEDLASINIGGYVEDLVKNLSQFYEVNSSKVAFKIDVEPIPLGVDDAICSGLIINELVSNSLKYAFPTGRSGEVKIALRFIDEKEIELIVSDNGIGIPENIDFGNTESFGLQLVNLLVKKHEGVIELDRTRGTTFIIKLRREKNG